METIIHREDLQKALNIFSENHLIPSEKERGKLVREIINGKYGDILNRFNLSETCDLHDIFEACKDICEICIDASDVNDKKFPLLNIPKFIAFLSLVYISTDKYIDGLNYNDFMLSILEPNFFKECSSFSKLKKEAELSKDFEKETVLECVKIEADRFRKYRTKELNNNVFFKENIKNREFNPSTIKKTSKMRKNDDYAAIPNYKKFEYTVNYFLSLPNIVDRPSKIDVEKREHKNRTEETREAAFDEFWKPIFEKHREINDSVPKKKEEYYNAIKRTYKVIWKNKIPDDFDITMIKILREALEIAVSIHANYKNFEYYLLQKKFSPIKFESTNADDNGFLIYLNKIQINYVKIYLSRMEDKELVSELVIKWYPILYFAMDTLLRIFESLKFENRNYKILLECTNHIDLDELKLYSDR